MSQDPIAVFYEHPEWFKPMFAEFERRGIPYVKLHAGRHWYDPARLSVPYSLIVNRMSPSAFTRGHADTIPYTLNYLAYLKDIGANVLNGYDAYRNEFSKAGQIALLSHLGIRHPKTRVIILSVMENNSPVAQEARDLGVFDYFRKPPNFQNLLERIAEAMA